MFFLFFPLGIVEALVNLLTCCIISLADNFLLVKQTGNVRGLTQRTLFEICGSRAYGFQEEVDEFDLPVYCLKAFGTPEMKQLLKTLSISWIKSLMASSLVRGNGSNRITR